MTTYSTVLIQPRDYASLRAASWGLVARAAALLKDLGPYAAIELLMPGGSLLALLLWRYRRRKAAAVAVWRKSTAAVGAA
jgi:hypothetical protein